MTLQNLVGTGQLKPHRATADDVKRLLASISRNLTDATLKGNSFETRFDCAYKAIMRCALVALLASGFRPSTNAPGHHQTMLQSLPLTLGVSNEAWIVLDALRKKRNQNDYTSNHFEGRDIEIRKVKYFNPPTGGTHTEDVKNLVCKPGSTCTANGDNLANAKNVDLNSIQVVFAYREHDNDWSDEFQTQKFVPAYRKCTEGKTYGPIEVTDSAG